MRLKILTPWLAMVCGLGVVLSAADRFEQKTIDNTAGGVALTSTIYDPVGQPLTKTTRCRLEGAEIRFTYDGTTVTTTVGTLLEVGETLKLTHDRTRQFRGIRTTGVSGILSCNYTSDIDP